MHVRLLLIAVLTVGFMARAATYRSPLFDFHSWRQADTAAISRNFVEERFNPLYPQTDWRRARAVGYVETGLELHAFAVAAISRLIGFSPAIGRLLNTAGFVLAGLLLFSFVRTRYGETAALCSAFLYALGFPLSLYMDRAFMNESSLALLSIACLWSAQRLCTGGSVRHLLLLAGAAAAIAMIKPTWLVVMASVAGLFVDRFGWRGLLRWQLSVVGAAAAAAGFLWFGHAGRLATETGMSFGISDKLTDPAILFSFEYWSRVFERLIKDVLAPVGMVFGAIGIVAAVRRRLYAELFGVLAFAIYLVVVTKGNFHHNYYQLPIVPVAAVLAGLGISAATDRWSNERHWAATKRTAVCVAILWIAAMFTFGRSTSAHNWYELNRSRMRLCDDLKPLLEADDRVVFVNDRNPELLFCLHRKGWLLDEHEGTPEKVAGYAAEGGDVVVLRKKDPAIPAALHSVGSTILETPDYRVVRISPAGKSLVK